MFSMTTTAAVTTNRVAPRHPFYREQQACQRQHQQGKIVSSSSSSPLSSIPTSGFAWSDFSTYTDRKDRAEEEEDEEGKGGSLYKNSNNIKKVRRQDPREDDHHRRHDNADCRHDDTATSSPVPDLMKIDPDEDQEEEDDDDDDEDEDPDEEDQEEDEDDVPTNISSSSSTTTTSSGGGGIASCSPRCRRLSSIQEEEEEGDDDVEEHVDAAMEEEDLFTLEASSTSTSNYDECVLRDTHATTSTTATSTKTQARTETTLSSCLSAPSNHPNTQPKDGRNGEKRVRFSEVLEVRLHGLTLGDHPCCRGGLALQCDWNVEGEECVDLDVYERFALKRRQEELYIAYHERRHRLRRSTGLSGYQLLQIEHGLFHDCSTTATPATIQDLLV